MDVNWFDPNIDAIDRFSPFLDVREWFDPNIDVVDRFSPALEIE